MPIEAKVFRGTIFRGIPLTVVAQVRALVTGDLLLPADVASGDFALFDTEGTTPTIPILTGSITPAIHFHKPRKDLRWSEDQVGFNFDHTIPHNAFPLGGRTYTLRYQFFAVGDTDPSALLVYQIYVQAV